MKKLFILFSLFVLTLSFVACGSTAESEPEEPKTFKVGETAKLDDVQVYLGQVSTGTSLTTTMGVPQTAPNGKVFLGTSWSLENDQDKDLPLSTENFECYIDDVLVDTSTVTYMVQNGFTGMDTVAPGKIFAGIIVYEIPQNWTKGEIYFKPNLFVDNKVTYEFTPADLTNNQQ